MVKSRRADGHAVVVHGMLGMRPTALVGAGLRGSRRDDTVVYEYIASNACQAAIEMTTSGGEQGDSMHPGDSTPNGCWDGS